MPSGRQLRTQPGKPISSWDSYLRETRQPVASLVFVTPMLIVYEVGILCLGPQAMRNGADVWLRYFLDWIGFGQYLLLPALTIFTLIAWQHLTRESWRFTPKLMGGMLLESILFGFLLLSIACLQGNLVDWSGTTLTTRISSGHILIETPTQIVGFFGAGIYEELLFRLLLLPLVAGLIRMFGATRRSSLMTAVVVTSVLFSAAHFRVFTSVGDSFQWYSFTFRFLAGVFFAVLFTYRGFGITAGAHTLYDIFATSLQVFIHH